MPANACAGEQIGVSFTGTLLPGAVVSWNFDGATILSGSGVGPYTLSWNSLGSHTVSVTVQQMGITTTESNTIEVFAVPTANFNVPAAVCVGESAAVNFTGTMNPATTLSWNFDGGVNAGADAANNNVSFGNTGNYSISLQVSENGCTSAVNTEAIEVRALPAGAISADAFACAVETISIEWIGVASSSATYSWDFDGATILSGSAEGPFELQWNNAANAAEDFVEKNPHLKPRIMIEINKNNERYDIPIDTVWTDTDIIITQSGGNKLKDVYKTLHPEELKNILFQIFYTLYVFEKIEFSHGDLYSWNIFIQDIPDTELCYLVGKQIFRFRTTKLVKIYDFDNSTLCKDTEITVNTTEKIEITHYLNHNREVGTLLNKLGATNIFNKNLDITMFCLMLDNDISDFFQRCFPGLSNSEKIGDTYSKEPLTNEDISNMSWEQYFKTIHHPRYGCKILKNVRKIIPKNGVIVACIPNMQHWSMIARLGIGDLRYEDFGLLDKTHLRWFTRQTIIEMFDQSGFKIDAHIPRIFNEANRELFLPVIEQIAKFSNIDPQIAISDSLPLQYVVRASLK
jgi:hypothetical protein